jgi:hypothetical protein
MYNTCKLRNYIVIRYSIRFKFHSGIIHKFSFSKRDDKGFKIILPEFVNGKKILLFLLFYGSAIWGVYDQKMHNLDNQPLVERGVKYKKYIYFAAMEYFIKLQQIKSNKSSQLYNEKYKN